MTRTVLVTGATGTLGRDLVTLLREQGHEVRGLSRNRPGYVHGDLRTGAGLREALDGADVVVHAATDGLRDVEGTRHLLDAMTAGPGRPHLIYVSIVGVPEIPLGYYRKKLAVEALVAGYGGATLRATQFHELVLTFAQATTRLPVGLYPTFDFQPVDTRDVADRLAGMVRDPRAGVIEELGGPERLSAKTLWGSYLRASGRRRALLPLRLPGGIFRAFRAGANTTPVTAAGGRTWEEFLLARFGR